MTDERLIGSVLQLQSRRLTQLQQAVDRLTAQLDAQADTLDKIDKTIRDGDDK